jgi:hypothetical protein
MKVNIGHAALCALGLLLALCLAGCAGEDSQAILDLVPLEMQMVAEYGGTNFVVELQDGSTLGITLAGDTARSITSDRGAEKAREIAGFVCQHYGSMDRIDTVEVTLAIRQEDSVVDTAASLAYAFARTELPCGER